MTNEVVRLSLMASQVYHVAKTNADGSRSWQGGRDLASSAEFTSEFCKKVLECWENRDSEDLLPDPVAAVEA